MEPTIYKPSIYKGAGIYKTGADGGGDIYISLIFPNKLCRVDKNGYIGEVLNDVLVYFSIVDNNADFSNYGLGQVSFYKEKLGVVNIGGRNYNTTKLNGTIWTRENLQLEISGIDINPAGTQTTPALYYQDESYKETYGYAYNAYAAEYIQNSGILPDGWRVATKSDFDNLVTLMGGDYTCAQFILSEIYGFLDKYKFTALCNGYYNGIYGFVGDFGNLWTNTPYSSSNNYSFGFGKDLSEGRVKNEYKYFGFPIRICKDA